MIYIFTAGDLTSKNTESRFADTYNSKHKGWCGMTDVITIGICLLFGFSIAFVAYFILLYKISNLTEAVSKLGKNIQALQKSLEDNARKAPFTPGISAGTQAPAQTATDTATPSTTKNTSTKNISSPVEACQNSTVSAAVITAPVPGTGNNSTAVTPALKDPKAALAKAASTSVRPASNRSVPEDTRLEKVLIAVWNWICVGEEYRTAGITAEYAVATTWLIRFGIIALLTGIGFFLKYSIDRNWVIPEVRVISMLIAGLAMTVSGIRYSTGKYRRFFIALLGGGFVVLYLSITAAYSLYALIGVTIAFIMMILITAGAMVSAVRVNAMLPALLGCVGGYLTPVFINTGSRNLVGLLIYFAIISAGTLFIAWRKDWTLLHLAALLLCVIIGGTAHVSLANSQNALAAVGLLCVLYLIFSLPPLLRADKKNFSLLDMFMLLGNVVFFFFTAISSANFRKDIELPAMAALYVTAVSVLELKWVFRRMPEEQLLKNFLLLIFSFSVSLTAALLLGGEWLCFSWSIMAFLMIFISRRISSSVLLLLGVILYLVNFVHIISAAEWHWTFTDRLLSTGVYILSMAAAGIFLNRTGEPEKSPGKFNFTPWLPNAFLSLAGIYFFFYSSNEIYRFLRSSLYAFRIGGISVWWAILAISMLIYGIAKNLKVLRFSAVGLFTLCTLKVFLVDLAELDQLWRITASVAVGLFILGGALLYIRFKDKFYDLQAGEKH